MYETLMGSVAYGVSGDASDCDIYGFCIPTKELVFPHLTGEIYGFGRQIQRFEQWQQHHVNDEQARKMYDLQIFNIVKYFQLLMENNPNIIDSVWTSQECVLHITHVGTMVRENRKLFLHKGCWHKFKGYAYSQLHKMSSKEPEGKRKEIREQFGFDVKFAYHVVRLLDEAEQILVHGDIDLMQNREQLKAIRRGDVPEEEIRKWAADKEKQLEELYHKSTLQYSPDEAKIKQLLMDCLEHHYGSLAACVVVPDRAQQTLRDISEILRRYEQCPPASVTPN
jgi:predicted nucleotidyltransferase